jgi:hypothetical protein
MSFWEVANSGILYILAAIVVLFVIVQSTVFLIKAWKEAKRIGIDVKRLKKAVASSAVFSIVPSLPIIISLFAMMPILGIPLPWIRLSVVGSAAYEHVAAESAGKGLGYAWILEASAGGAPFAAIAIVMTVGIIWGLTFSTFYQKKLQTSISSLREKDTTWAAILVDCLFVGLAAAFGGQMIAAGGVTLLTLLTSMALMFAFYALAKLPGMKWMESFAMSLSMVGAMGMAILYTVCWRRRKAMKDINNKKKEKIRTELPPYERSLHRLGKMTGIAAVLLFLAVPAIVCTYFNAWPPITGLLNGIVAVSSVYLPLRLSRFSTIRPCWAPAALILRL